MEINNLLADEVVLVELGERLARRRLDRGLTQAEMAEQAGVSKRTVERIEAGASTQLAKLVRLLRALELLGNIEQLVPAAEPGPMELLRHGGKERKRASSVREEEGAEPWSWNDKD